LLEEYSSIFIVTVDNVSSQQMHEIRHALRGEGVVLMGKNTMVRESADSSWARKLTPIFYRFAVLSRDSSLKSLLTSVFSPSSKATLDSSSPMLILRYDQQTFRLEIYLLFCLGIMLSQCQTIRDKILANKVAAPARAGAVAPADVFVPAGNTGMEPGKTSFFQALGVPTKIARGTIEITADLKLVEAGSKVGASEATLLNMLNISPFTYGMGISQVYDQGNTFPPSVLDIEESQLLKTFASAITTIACISLAANFPTLPSVMHSVVNSYKKVLAVAVETEYGWPEIEELKDRIANPDAYASAGPAVTSTETAKDDAPAEEEKADSEAEESGDEGFGGLFD
jgi:large subunit ribosomal protein LP0